MTPLQATGVALGGRALLIEGPPGCGKSSLALALIDHGALLIGDDGVLLEARGRRVWAHPAPHIAGLIEVRNVGIVAKPTVAAPVALIVALDDSAPRFPETIETVVRLGCEVPIVRLWPGSPVLALRAEHALALHGLA